MDKLGLGVLSKSPSHGSRQVEGLDETPVFGAQESFGEDSTLVKRLLTKTLTSSWFQPACWNVRRPAVDDDVNRLGVARCPHLSKV